MRRTDALTHLKHYLKHKDGKSATKTIEFLRTDYMPFYIGKYLSMRNSAFSREDIIGEFWFGVAKNLDRVDIKIGDPFAFLANHGRYRVLTLIKTELRHFVSQTCLECGHESQYFGICRKCGSDKISAQSKLNEDQVQLRADDINTVSVDRQYYINLFTGRRKEIMEFITDEKSPHSPLNSKNYLKSLANHFGCSAAAIAKHMRIIRKTLAKYY